MNSEINRSMNIIRNLPAYLEASRLKSHDGTTPKDYALNRCLTQIERIKRHAESDDIEPVLSEAWGVYMDMQSFGAAGGERQDYNAHREVHMDALDEEALVIDDGEVIETSSPEVYAGGLGYKHVNWDSSYLMARPKGGINNPYWRPDNAKKAGQGGLRQDDGKVPRNRR